MNNNLPQIKKDGIFEKLRKWLNGLLGIEKISEEEHIQEKDKPLNENDFRKSIQVESKDAILALQRKLKENQIEISDLTDKELDEMIELYKKQIEERKISQGNNGENSNITKEGY